MANKTLVMDAYEEDGYKALTLLSGSAKDELIYAEFHTNQGEPDILEMATDVQDIIKMRDFLNTIISKIGPAGEYTEDNIFIKAREEAI